MTADTQGMNWPTSQAPYPGRAGTAQPGETHAPPPAADSAAERYRAEVRRSADALAEAHSENGALRGKLQKLAGALRELAADLAESRRTCRVLELEIAVLRAEAEAAGARGRADGTPTG